MLTGRFPRDFPAGKDPWRVVLESAPVLIRKHLPSIPAKLAGVIDHALIDQPEIPIKTAAELKRQLKEAI
jgi:serine/threonine-protein kinase